VFISAVTQKGIMELKDLLWKALNAESNKIAAITHEESIVHRNKDISLLQHEMLVEGEDEEIEFLDDDEYEIEDYEEEEWD
jgi:GTP-binding protein